MRQSGAHHACGDGMTTDAAAPPTVEQILLTARRLYRVHLVFPEWIADQALGYLTERLAVHGWHPAGQGDAYRLWRRDGRGTSTIVGVLVGLVPPTVSLSCASPAVPFAGMRGRSTLRRLAATARPVALALPDRQLGAQIARDQANQQALAVNRERAHQLGRQLTHRQCPQCQEWSRTDAQWCRSCEREFTAADNHHRDLLVRASRQEITALDATVQAIRRGGFPVLGDAMHSPLPPARGPSG
jgi:hypothetical protein